MEATGDGVLQWAWLIPLFPLAAFGFQTFFGKRLGERTSLIGIVAMGLAFLYSTLVLVQVLKGASIELAVPWARTGDIEISMGFRIANLEAALLFVVSFVAWMVQIYSAGYMHGDPRFNRFFAIVNLFTAGMLALLIADNFILFMISWEIMGLCSYLLIGHWFEDPNNAKAAMKAFMTTRLGDVGLLLGIWALFSRTGSFNFNEIFHAAESGALTPEFLTVAGILLLLGTVGKSAQVPLHVWLPDAMAGPTPVSALIHAATMVAAGVFLVARAYPIFHLSTSALAVVAFVGAITALLGATIATVAEDIKKVLAYSTVSQLGYMVFGLGVGGFTAGLFHLMTHAFFKGLLFLGSGSVIHAAHTQNMHEMGGLFRKMKITAVTFIIGSLALAGIPPFSGFFSKDEILLEAYYSDYPIIFWMGVVAAFLTAYYMTRAVWLTFFGKPRDHHKYEHAHESPWVMTLPLVILAVPATLAGLAGSGATNHFIQEFITFGEHHAEPSSFVQMVALGAAVSGILVGYLVYGLQVFSKRTLIRAAGPIYALFKNKWYFDEVYQATVVNGGLLLSNVLGLFDKYVVDGIVNATGYLTVKVSEFSGAFDWGIIDGMVNGVASTVAYGGSLARRLVTGYVQTYVMVLFATAILGLVAYLLI